MTHAIVEISPKDFAAQDVNIAKRHQNTKIHPKAPERSGN
jgi:hypothetical protein